MPAIQPYIIEPIWEQFRALLPERKVDHPLGCHRPRIPDCVVFEKQVEVLVFGCAYWRIADGSCSATTLRRRHDEWIEAGLMDALEDMALEAYDRAIGLDLADVAVDCCITKAPCGGEKAGRSPVDRGKQSIKRSMMVDACGIPLGVVAAQANRHDSPLLAPTLDALEALGLREAIYSCRKGGTVFALGVFVGLVDKFPMGALMNKGLTLRGAQQHGERYIPMLLERMAAGELKTSHLMTHPLPLDEGPRGYDMFKNKIDGCVRAVFQPNGSS